MEQPHNPVYGEAAPILTHPRVKKPMRKDSIRPSYSTTSIPPKLSCLLFLLFYCPKFCAIIVGKTILLRSFVKQRKYPQEHNRSYCSRYKTADDSGKIKSNHAEQPTAKNTADYTYYHIDKAAVTATLHKSSGYCTGTNTN